MHVEIIHLSKYLLKANVTESCRWSLDGVDQGALPAFRSVDSEKRLCYLFRPGGFRNGSIISFTPNDVKTDPTSIVVTRPTRDESYERALCSVGLHSAPDWAIDDVSVVGNHVRFNGWLAWTPESNFCIRVDGRPCTANFHVRGDLADIFKHLKHLRVWMGYSAEAEIGNGDGEVVFSLSDPRAMCYYYSLNMYERYASPSIEQIHRVIGTSTIQSFNRAGYSNYKKIRNVTKSVIPNRSKYEILDWGCGCGGLARYFLQDPDYGYIGCDIDCDNLRWCNENLERGRFVLMLLNPPVDNPFHRQFDVIFGISVISHLSPPNIRSWLTWLSTLLDKDGILILSTLSTQSLAKMYPSDMFDIMVNNYAFYNDKTEIGSVISNQDYYRVGYQTPKGLSQLCGENLILTHHIPAGLSHQDLFVMQLR